jgi:hypothetical protein
MCPTLHYMSDRPKRRPAATSDVDTFFRSVYDSLAKRVLEEAAESAPAIHADAASERKAKSAESAVSEAARPATKSTKRRASNSH